LSARSKNNESKDHCPLTNQCREKGLTLREEAQDAATLSTVAFALGGGLLAAGVLLYVMDEPSADSGLAVGAQVASGQSQLMVWGTF
jgi:hypothetical protein